MKVIIDIPNYEFDNDVEDKFQDYFNRVKQDIAKGTLCGNYELETTDMFLASFERMQVLPDNATNGDMVKAMFPDVEFTRGEDGISTYFMKMDNDAGFASLYETWWNAPYRKEDK